ncbi:MAG: phospholipase D-like domain-containing protein [Halobacteriota archaeon]
MRSIARHCVLVVVLLVASACSVPLADVAVGQHGDPIDDAVGTADHSSSTPSAADSNATRSDPRIVELYPNPPTRYDRGEYLIVSIPHRGNWSVSDGTTTVSLSENQTGLVAITRDPTWTDHFTDAETYEAPGGFQLADRGETLTLSNGAQVVDEVTYARAPKSERWHRDVEGRWLPDGYVPRDPAQANDTAVTAFVLPDSPTAPIEPIERAEDRVLVGAYTVTSWRLVEELLAAKDRGVTVGVLVDGNPVGGMSTRQGAVLDTLAAEGVPVHVLAGETRRFRFQHAKYAIADDTTVVVTENWKPSGTGGSESRGWGVVVEGVETANALHAVYEHDTTWTDTVPWVEYRDRVQTRDSTAAVGEFPENHPPRTGHVDEVTLLTAPGNAEDEVVDRIAAANERVDIVQPSVGGPDQRMVRSAIAAAERGVRVRILLSDAWYSVEENRALAAHLNGRAERANIPLSVRVDEPGDRYGKIHAKGVIVDDAAIVGSMNWNDNSARNNREVAVVLRGEAITAYYSTVFEADWEAGRSDGPTKYVQGVVLLVVGVGAGVTVLYARRSIAFRS